MVNSNANRSAGSKGRIVSGRPAVRGRHERAMLYGTVALAALGIASPALAVDTSTYLSTVSIGDFTYTYDDGDVHVTGIGSYGFYFEGTGVDTDFTIGIDASVQSDDESAVFGTTTGDFGLTSTGNFASTKAAIDLDAGGAITIDHTGDLTSWEQEGISATAAGNVSATFEGDIDALGDGIYVNSYGDGTSVQVDATGSIFSRSEDGIHANADGPVTVTFTGNKIGSDIDALDDAIYANSYGVGDEVLVTVTGDLLSREGKGVNANGAGNVTVNMTDGSTVDSNDDGIYANSYGGNVEITATDLFVDSDNGHGVYGNASGNVTISLTDGASITAQSETDTTAVTANSIGGKADLTLQGSFTSKDGTAIYGHASGLVELDVLAGSTISGKTDAVELNSYGVNGGIDADIVASITSANGQGIDALASGAVGITYQGVLLANGDGINATAYGNLKDVTVTVNGGSITSTNGKGIDAIAQVGNVDISNSASIQSRGDGITAEGSTAGFDANTNLIYEESEWAGDVTVDNWGTINSDLGSGINAVSNFHTTTVQNYGTITSYYDGILAHSLGDYADASVSVTNEANIQSDQGGGINAKSTFKSVTIDSTGVIIARTTGIYALSQGSSNSSTSVTNDGNITAYTQRGIHAESVSGSVTVDNTGNITAKTEGIYALGYGDAVGAVVDVTQNGNIISYDSYGIFARATRNGVSVNASGNITSKESGIYARAEGANGTSVVEVDYQSGTITSYSGHGIDASSTVSSVTVNNHGTVHTQGTGKDGIRVVSNTTAPLSRATVNQHGTVKSESGYGIYAYATEGGVTIHNEGSINGNIGGIYASATGDVDDATVIIENSGDVFSWNNAAIYGESDSESVTVTHTGGSALGGSYGIQAIARTTTANVTIGEDAVVENNNVADILLDAIGGSTLTNYGTITGGPGLALQTKGYNGTTVHNYGTISGAIEFNSGVPDFYNEVGGVYNITSLTTFTDGVFHNSGTLSPGGSDEIEEAYLQSRYIQGEDGVLLVDVDGTDADHLQVDGNAELDGKVQLNFITALVPTEVTVLSSWWLDERNLTLANLIVDANILYVNDTDVVIDINGYDFSPEFAEGNGNDVGEALNQAYLDGNTAIEPILAALANLTTEEEYQEALEELSPEIVADNAAAQITANAIFTNKLFSCKVQDGAYRITAEGECSWVSVSGGKLQRDATDEAVGYTQSWGNVAAGSQWAVGDDLRFGVAVGYTTASAETEAQASSDSSSGEVGAVLKYEREGVILGGAVTAGFGTTDSTRTVDFGGLDEIITGSGSSSYVSGRLSAAYAFEYGAVYAKPIFDLDLTQLNIGGYEEEGGVSAQTIEASSHFIATITPALELGGEVDLKEDMLARGYFRIGAALSTGNDIEATARLVGSGDTYTVTSDMDNAVLKLSTGVDVINADNATLRVYYDGAFGETTTSNAVGVKLTGKIF